MEQLNIVELIEKSPLTRLSKSYQSAFINKIKDSFTESQQSLFVSSFYCYLNYNSKTDFVIDLDNVWKWLGFSRKDPAKRVLEKHFTLDIDYKSIFHQAVENKIETRGRKEELILLNLNTFKKLCLKAGTKMADEIHDYFIKLEEIYHEILDEESNELRTQIQEKTTKNILDKQNILLQSYHKVSVVYLIKINENLYKFGETDNIKRRFNEHRREIGENIHLVYCIKSNNNSLLEQKLKDYLRTTKYRKEQAINGRIQTELLEIDNIHIIESELESLNKNLIDDKRIILELKAEILELRTQLELYKNGKMMSKVFSDETYNNFIQNNLEYNPKSKVDLTVVMKEYEKYVKENNIKVLQKNMFSKDLLNFYGYSIDCKDEMISAVKNFFTKATYKDKGVKRHFVNVSLKNCTTFFHNQVYDDYVTSRLQVGDQSRDCKNGFVYKVRKQYILTDFLDYIQHKNISSLFKMNENDALFTQELTKKICEITKSRIGCVKHNGIDHQSFVGIKCIE